MKQLVMAALGLAVAAGTAQAQVGGFQGGIGTPFRPGPFGGPPVGIGLFSRPQFEAFRTSAQTLPGQGATAQQSVTPMSGTTGHPVRFFYYSHYYTFPAPRFGPGSVGGASTPSGVSPGRDFGLAPPPPTVGILVNSAIIRTGDR